MVRDEMDATAARDFPRLEALAAKRKRHVPVAQRTSPELSMTDPHAMKALLTSAGLKSPRWVGAVGHASLVPHVAHARPLGGGRGAAGGAAVCACRRDG